MFLKLCFSIFLSISLIFPPETYSLYSGNSEEIVLAKQNSLAVWEAGERGVSRIVRAAAYRNLFEKKLAPIYGGKGAWSKILERLGIKVPETEYFTIKDLWAKFIEANQDLIVRGESLIREDLRDYGSISDETERSLDSLVNSFCFPLYLRYYIKFKTRHFKGPLILRSSGDTEDSYLRSLAGVLSSEKRIDAMFASQAIQEVFDHAVRTIWITQNKSKERVDGLPRELTPESGIAIVVQPFFSFQTSGTINTNVSGYTSIEAVIGDAETAVRPIFANVARYLFEKGKMDTFEYNPSFLRMPHNVIYKWKEYSVEKNPGELAELVSKFPVIDGNFSPLTKKQVICLNEVANTLEEEIGIPIDIEWGYLEGQKEPFIIQIRPIIGDSTKPLVIPIESLKNRNPVAQTPVALGSTKPEGFTGKMVIIENKVDSKVVEAFEKTHNEDYIRVQAQIDYLVAEEKRTLGFSTRAKVLVDPEQGARQAHNIKMIEKRIYIEKEFCYCNGPILKKDLLENLNFIPYPGYEGIWISREDVTYFSDRIRAHFYAEKEDVAELDAGEYGTSPKTQIFTDLTRFVAVFLNAEDVSDQKKATIKFLKSFGLDILAHYYMDRGREQRSAGEISDAVNRYILETDQFVSFREFLKRLSELRSVLEVPLWPESWEMKLIESLKQVTEFLPEYENYLKEQQFCRRETRDTEQKTEKGEIIPRKKREGFVNYAGGSSISDKFRMLIIEDERLILRSLIKKIGRRLSREAYKVRAASSYDQVKEALEKEKFDLIAYDCGFPNFGELKKLLISSGSQLAVVSGYNVERDKIKLLGKALADRTSWFVQKPFDFETEFMKLIRKAREETEFSKMIPKDMDPSGESADRTTDGKETRTARQSKDPEIKTIFILNNFSARSKCLAEYIRVNSNEQYEIITVGSLFFLKEHLKNDVPNIIIADINIETQTELNQIREIVKKSNPDVEFIITSKMAAGMDKVTMGKDVLGVLETPFYYDSVIDVIEGTFEDKKRAARERFNIEQSLEIVNRFKKIHSGDSSGVVSVWSGYAAPRYQKNMLTCIRKKTEDSPYEVRFMDGIGELVTLACGLAGDKNAVTILPYKLLSPDQRALIVQTGAKVIFMDLQDSEILLEMNSIVQLNAIIFSGIAYLNDNEKAFRELYRIVTGKTEPAFFSLEKIKRTPGLIKFMVRRVEILDDAELKRLNGRMKQVIISA